MKKSSAPKTIISKPLVPYVTGLVAIIIFVVSIQKMIMFALQLVLIVGSLFNRGTYDPGMGAILFIGPLSLILGIILSVLLSVGVVYLLTLVLLKKK